MKIRERFAGELDNEISITRRILERVPDDKFDWKPHPKSFSLGQLASHIATIGQWWPLTVSTNFLDFAQPMPPPKQAATSKELIETFDDTWEKTLAVLWQTEDEAMLENWELRRGEKVLLSHPRVVVLRAMIINHMVHHRGQLSVYLRLLDVPVPSIYGPSADDDAAF